MIANPFASYNIEISKKYQEKILRYCQSSGTKESVMFAPFERQIDLWFVSFLYAVNKELPPTKLEDSYNATSASILGQDPSRISILQLCILGITEDAGYLANHRKVFDYCLELANSGIPYILEIMGDPDDRPLHLITDLLEELGEKNAN